MSNTSRIASAFAVFTATLFAFGPQPYAQGEAKQRVRVETYKQTAKLPSSHQQALERHGVEVVSSGPAGRVPTLLFVQKADASLPGRVRELLKGGQGPVMVVGSSSQSFKLEAGDLSAKIKAAGASRVVAWDADASTPEIRGALTEDVARTQTRGIVSGMVAALNGEGIDRHEDATSRIRTKVKPDGSFISIIETQRAKRPRVGPYEPTPQPTFAMDKARWEQAQRWRAKDHAQRAAEDEKIGEGSPLGRLLGVGKPEEERRYQLGIVLRGEGLELRKSFHGEDEIVGVNTRVVRAYSSLGEVKGMNTTQEALLAIQEVDFRMARSWLNASDFILEVVGRTRDPKWNVPVIVKAEKSLRRPLQLQTYGKAPELSAAHKDALRAAGIQLDSAAAKHGARVPTLLLVQTADGKLVEHVAALARKGPVVVAGASAESLSRIEGKPPAALEQELLLAGASLVTSWDQSGTPAELVSALYGRPKTHREYPSFLP